MRSLCFCLDLLIMNVIDAGSGIKYQSAIGSHGQVNEGILVRYLFRSAANKICKQHFSVSRVISEMSSSPMLHRYGKTPEK